MAAAKWSSVPDTSDARVLVVRPEAGWQAVKVFTEPLNAGSSALCVQVTTWLSTDPGDVVEYVVAQSGDERSGCVSVVVFYRPRVAGG